MDSGYQQAMIQALMGGVAQPGVMASGQTPTTGYGAAFITGNPTVPGGMLGASPYQTINPNMPTPSSIPNGQQMQQPYAQYPNQMMPPVLGGNNDGGASR